MSVAYTIDANECFALVTSKGQLTTSRQTLEYVKGMIHELLEHEAKKVLMDNRELDGKRLSFFDKYDLATWLSKDSTKRTIKWAMVVNSDRMNSLKELETLLRNRGFTFLGFDSIHDAKTWLDD